MPELILGEALDVLIDHRGKTPKKLGGDFTSSGVPVASALLVRDGRLALEDARFVSEATYARWMAVPTKRHDVVLTSEAPLGRVALVPSDNPLVLGQRLFGLRGRRGLLDSRFLYYALQTDMVQHDLHGRSTGTTVTGIRQSELVRVRIPAPRYAEQRAIAGVLGALDDKIALNDQVTHYCDQLRRARLREYLSQESQIVEASLSNLADFVNGRAFTKGATGTGRMVVRIAELNSGTGGSTVYNDIMVPDQHLARPGDVLFAWSGSLTVARWYRSEAIVNQHIFKVVPRDGLPRWLLFDLVARELRRFRGIAADKATTMGHIQRHHLDEPIVVPRLDDVPILHRRLGPLWDRALSAECESLALAGVRDVLLPRLMSGEIRVRDAEKAVEEVL